MKTIVSYTTSEYSHLSLFPDYRRPRFVGSFQKIGDGTPIRCGLVVYDVDDERHVGRIIAYKDGEATVRWLDSGWLSYVRYDNLRQANNF